MEILIKISLIAAFLLVIYQDIKEREVYWFLFPMIGVFAGYLFFKGTLPELFFVSVVMNLILSIILISVVFLYSKIKLEVSLKSVMGLGDLLLLFFLSFSFSTISYIIILIGSFIFSLAIHMVLKSKSKILTVPLAGYMCLFFLITYLSYWTGIIDSLYNF